MKYPPSVSFCSSGISRKPKWVVLLDGGVWPGVDCDSLRGTEVTMYLTWEEVMQGNALVERRSDFVEAMVMMYLWKGKTGLEYDLTAWKIKQATVLRAKLRRWPRTRSRFLIAPELSSKSTINSLLLFFSSSHFSFDIPFFPASSSPVSLYTLPLSPIPSFKPLIDDRFTYLHSSSTSTLKNLSNEQRVLLA